MNRMPPEVSWTSLSKGVGERMAREAAAHSIRLLLGVNESRTLGSTERPE